MKMMLQSLETKRYTLVQAVEGVEGLLWEDRYRNQYGLVSENPPTGYRYTATPKEVEQLVWELAPKNKMNKR